MAKPKPIECPKCGSDKVVQATDKSNKHYCQKCGHVWVPGVDPMKREDLALLHYKTENIALKEEIEKVRKENLSLKGQIEELQKHVPVTEPGGEDEIFS